MHSLQPQQNAQLRPRGHDENILEEAYRGRYARQRLLNFWPESSCGYHAIKRFVCIIQVEPPSGTTRNFAKPTTSRSSIRDKKRQRSAMVTSSHSPMRPDELGICT